jgi:DNA-binding MarR family transcriptional regulator
MSIESSSAKRGEMVRRVQTGLRRLTHELHRLNDVVGSRIELLPGDLEVLDMIGRRGSLSPRDISTATGIHPATLTGMLDRLGRGGWMSRRPDTTDRRKVVVEVVTERGPEVARLYAPMSKALTQICSDYSDEDLARIVEFLDRAGGAAESVSQTMRDGDV